MKTITRKTFIRVPTYVWTVMVLLILSSMIGATVWAKKANPGKPSPEPETADFEIKIGVSSGPQHITLNTPDSLLVQNLDYYGRWLPPPTKGLYNFERWSVNSMNSDGGLWSSYGTYIIANVENDAGVDLVEALNIHPDQTVINKDALAYGFTLYHNIQNHPQVTENDYWYIGITWQVDTMSSDPETPHLHALIGRTNIDAEWEGVYDKINDTWTVTFNNAEFVVIGNCENGGDIELIWEGALSFTVNITRILV